MIVCVCVLVGRALSICGESELCKQRLGKLKAKARRVGILSALAGPAGQMQGMLRGALLAFGTCGAPCLGAP
eukprot:CAMPEP_0179193518 /NCGR_PEP_ID=MMETSP0796-20121207/96168_1 /TAXON_ID=73915 /ORGANISM="Pyrodinium bahamense, Strain pbaha01" /LENGTH=71 /DNA_ID=CAMNT_0020897825 /DNA_START=70 /DNA_END=282 /DNA_ORIENTATION=-